MGYLLILLGLHQLVSSRRRRAPRALCLGAGLVLVGWIDVLEEGSQLHQGLSWLAWPVLVAALFLCHRDGTLADTFLCRRGRGKSWPGRPGA